MALQPNPPKTSKIKPGWWGKGQEKDAVGQKARESGQKLTHVVLRVFFPKFNSLVEKFCSKKTLINDQGVN